MTKTHRTKSFRRMLLPCLPLLALSALATSARASDPVGIYAVVEKVVTEPADGTPQRVQVWGVFSLNEGERRDPYSAPAYGYLYYRADEKPDAARREWADLKSVAGTGQVVAFASRWKEKGRVRKAGDKPDAPDAYPVAMGVTKVRGGDWGPAAAIRQVPFPVTPEPVAEVEAGDVKLTVRNGKSRDAEPSARYVFQITAPGGEKETSEPVEAGADGKTTWSPKMKAKAGETYTWRVWRAGAEKESTSTSVFKAKGEAGAAK